MSCYLIQVERGRKVACPVSNAQEYRALRDTNEQRKNLELARGGDDQAKRKLVQFNYSGHYPEGTVKGANLPSRAFGFDLDSPEDFERAKGVLLQDPEKFGLLMLERSVRQGGHAVFRREMGKTILENQVRMACLLECELDTNAHDVNRVYFSTTADPAELLYVSDELFTDIYVEEEVKAEQLALEQHQEVLPDGAHKANKHFRPWEQEIFCPETNADAEPFPEPTEEPNYSGIPYREIIDQWWVMYNDGETPVKSNRDVLTYELAVNLRHICGFDRELLGRVIPCYDDFPQAQKMKCIDSALEAKRSQMPKRLKDVINYLRRSFMCKGDTHILQTVDQLEQMDELFYYQQLPKMVLAQGVKDSIEAIGPKLTMPALVAICPAIGALATGVKLDVHGTENTLNLISYVVGDFGSGKGKIDKVIDAWTFELQAEAKKFDMEWEAWRNAYKAARNKKEQPVEPVNPKRWIPLNNTVANLSQELANAQGGHAFSFTPEADTVAMKWKKDIGDASVMLRQSYDASAYAREARSVDSVNVHIDHLLWNVVMCGTPDALYRVITNYTDGFQSRIAVASTVDNTFSELEAKTPKLLPHQEERIQAVAHLLPFMQGTLYLNKLEQQARNWLKQVRMETIMNDDRTRARQRFRVCVTAQRMMCCLILCMVCERLIKEHGFMGAELKLKLEPGYWMKLAERFQTPSVLKVFDLLADYMIEQNLLYFRHAIESAERAKDSLLNHSASNRSKRGKNDTIFERLDSEFSMDQAFQQSVSVKGYSTENMVRCMLKNWITQRLVEKVDELKYRKV